MKPVSILVLLLFVALPVGQALAKEPTTGGWSQAEVTKPEVVAAANFAMKEEAKELQKSKETSAMQWKLVSIVSAEEQVVAGMNYRLILTDQLDGKKREAEAIVWWQAWNKDAPYKLTAWTWQ